MTHAPRVQGLELILGELDDGPHDVVMSRHHPRSCPAAISPWTAAPLEPQQPPDAPRRAERPDQRLPLLIPGAAGDRSRPPARWLTRSGGRSGSKAEERESVGDAHHDIVEPVSVHVPVESATRLTSLDGLGGLLTLDGDLPVYDNAALCADEVAELVARLRAWSGSDLAHNDDGCP